MTQETKEKLSRVDTLNDQQREGFNQMMDFINGNEHKMFCLKGYAGTGKTYLITTLIESITAVHKYKMIAISAPTNKAVAVLKEQSDTTLRENPFVSFTTIHKILGVKAVITEDGKEVFRADKQPEIDFIDVLIIDEVSMLNDELFFKIIDHIDNTKVIFIGDPCQVPPVGKVDCEPFLNPDKYGIYTFTLSQIMRQADGSDLVKMSFTIRENVNTWHISHVQMKKGSDIELLHSTSEDDRKNVREMMDSLFTSEAFRKTPQEYRVVCWRNVRVRWYNDFIRKHYHGTNDLPQIVVKDLLIANAPVVDDERDIILLHNSQEVEVLSVEEKEVFVDKKPLRCFDCKVQYWSVDASSFVQIFIQILKEEDEPKLKKILERKADWAKQATNPKERRMRWVMFFKIKNRFADMSHAFALSTHKSQGSTFMETIVDMKDINMNTNVTERNRIAYTAITRAKRKCTIIIP